MQHSIVNSSKVKFYNIFCKKNCLNCAFCIRKKRWHKMLNFYSGENNLSNEEIIKIKNKDFSFLEKPKKFSEESALGNYNKEIIDQDYLMCWKEQWNFKDKIDNKIKLKNYKCYFYYNVKNKINKTYEACDEELKENKSSKLTWKTAIAGAIVGVILTTIFGCVFSKYSDNTKDKKDSLKDQIEELNKIKIPTVNLDIKG